MPENSNTKTLLSCPENDGYYWMPGGCRFSAR